MFSYATPLFSPPLALILLPLAFSTFVSAAPEPATPRISHTYPDHGETRSPDRTLAAIQTGPVSVICYDTLGRLLMVGGSDGVIQVRDAATGGTGTGALVAKTSGGRTNRILAMAFTGDSKTLVSFAADQTVRTWDAGYSNCLKSIRLDANPRCAAFCPGNEPLLAEATGRQVRLWNCETGTVTKTLEPQDAAISCLAVGPDRRMLASATENNEIVLWDVASGKAFRTIDALADVRCLALSSNHIAAGCADGTVQVWPIEGQQGVVIWEGHTGPVNALAFDSKGGQLASASADKTVRVWNVEDGTLLCIQQGHDAPVVSVVFNPNGQKMASGGADGTVEYWIVPMSPIAPENLDKK
jgi:WD40 repeat protein